MKRVGIAALVVVALIAVAAARADAGSWTIVNGKLVYRSVDCEALLKGTGNPNPNDPSLLTCTLTDLTVDTVCENPTNHQITPGQAALQVARFVGSTTDNNFVLQGKGKAVGTIPQLVPTCSGTPQPGDACLLGLGDDVCVNPNWHLVNVLVRSATLQVDTQTCNDSNSDQVFGCQTDFSPADTQTYECTLTTQYGFGKKQTFPPPSGTPYDCQ